MQSQNKFFDDLSRLATGAAGTMAGMGREMEGRMKERLQEFVGGMDMVSREEFDAVKEMAANARAEVEALRARLEALEGKASTDAKPAPKQPKMSASPPKDAE
jgi:BMFP domain-containing protein YqiC|tara:strand:+ start:55653 stop:55961 length:309 start_codon:yes stop_codon:yes gene_type:complete